MTVRIMCVVLTLNELEWEHPPRVLEYGDVEEPEDVAEEAHAQHLHVTQLRYERRTEEIRKDLRHVVYHRRQPKQRRRSTKVLREEIAFWEHSLLENIFSIIAFREL
jgi:hypothetical protein